MNTLPTTLLMIRAYDQAVDFVAELALPNPVIYAPMVQIEQLNTGQTLPPADLVIFTSANALRLYADKTQHRGDVFCVGSVTKRAATERGFNILQSFETAEQLIGFFRENTADTKSILYPRAETVSHDITTSLSAMGCRITGAILYRQTFLPLSDQAIKLIESSPVLVPVLSKEIAKRMRAALTPLKPRDLSLVCISPAVAAVFNGFNVKTAQSPTRAALMEQIKICFVV
ncbi:MAG: uroporphyrinogen-III synthase [Amylibacter sp.]|nr:uroporphyrinogen-III synthase [Amylibacter sp.]